ncbi:hypothetical protein HYW35_04230 [Candidatus Saccharibacteria bacterium]|nr:hypothetical protein [Candidatus Saccharibacteria bacterium]
MSLETQPTRYEAYETRVATVVGGRGQLGSRIVQGLGGLGFNEVRVCEIDDSLTDSVRSSTDLFFAVDASTTDQMLRSVYDLLGPQHSVLDGSSVKSTLIPVYHELDNHGISVCSTHLGAVPAQPWRGVKVWLCEVGPNSEKAIRLATDLFLAKNTSIQKINISDHEKVEQDQFLTFFTMHLLAGALRQRELPLSDFNKFATLNAELAALALGRTLGQGTVVPSEILHSQPRKKEFLDAISGALEELKKGLDDRGKLQELMLQNIMFHDDPAGVIKSMFGKAGVVGARNANLRMYAFSFRTTDDRPGKLRELLGPFYEAGANLTAIDSMPGVITPEEEQQGVDPDKIVDFDIGIDPDTIDPQKVARIKAALTKMGCVIANRQIT